MRALRKNVAIAIDGGGIRGIIVTRALMAMENALGMPVGEIFSLAAGTSTGSIISAGIAAGLTAEQMYKLYVNIGPNVFKKSLRTLFWPLTRYRYENEPFIAALRESLGDVLMGDFWSHEPQTDVVITTFDLKLNSTRFIKPWKIEYRDWPAYRAVMASSTVPTYFPVLEGRYVDGGVGSYSNPCYLAAYELKYCLRWDPAETTLISLGTGRAPYDFTSDEANKKWPWEWLQPIMGAFLQSADDQQVHLVKTFFQKLDFRRFQVDLNQDIPMDDVSHIPRLTVYGDELGKKILADQIDYAQMVQPKQIPEYSQFAGDSSLSELAREIPESMDPIRLPG